MANIPAGRSSKTAEPSGSLIVNGPVITSPARATERCHVPVSSRPQVPAPTGSTSGVPPPLIGTPATVGVWVKLTTPVARLITSGASNQLPLSAKRFHWKLLPTLPPCSGSAVVTRVQRFTPVVRYEKL